MANTLPMPLGFAGELAEQDPVASIRAKSRIAMIATAALVFGFGGAAGLVPIGGAVVAQGQVGVESRVKRVAHASGGAIAEIFVRNGDRVAKGAPLMRLDDVVAGSDAALSSLSVDQLLAQRARLEAEQVGAATIAFPAELAARTDPGARKAIRDESRLFAARRREMAQSRAQLRARIAQFGQQIAGQRAQIDSLGQQSALIAPERAGLERLYDKGLVTLTRRNALERQSIDINGGVATLNAQIAQAQAQIGETRAQIGREAAARRSEAGIQLAATNAALNQQEQRQVAAGDAQTRSLIRAPYAGVVDKLAFAAVGEVIKPAETILEVVPEGDRMVVEAMISPTDIDQMRIGAPARIRFSAFNAGTTPEIAGSVVQVAPDRTVDPSSRQSFYVARVAIDRQALSSLPAVKLVPGMPAEVMIRTGSRSLLSYLTKPLRDQITRAFRDK